MEYKDFLLGKTWDKKMLAIDFEDVTKKFEDYILNYFWSTESSLANIYNSSSLPTAVKKPYLSYIGQIYESLVKCYAIDIPVNTVSFVLTMHTDIFPDGIRPILNGFAVSFHYPNQFLKSFDNMRIAWPVHLKTQNTSLFMLMKINTFEVTIRRNSRKHTCNPKWREYDFYNAQKKYSDIGCRPVFDIWNSSYPTCDSAKKMAMAATPFGEMKWKNDKNSEPCQSADKIIFDYQETYASNPFQPHQTPKHIDVFATAMQMPFSRSKVIEQKQAYDLQNLIGNSGGYIGLFLGTYIFSN
jgi:hypothetical protein